MEPKLISVVMPVLNGTRFIREAVASIAAQTYPRVELVLVDDGSTDGTYELVKQHFPDLNIRLVRHEKCQGIARSVNDGIRHASGELVAFLDHDDTWFPNFLETQASYLAHHPEAAMVHSDFQTVDVDGNILEESVARCRQRSRPSGIVFRELFEDCFICANAVLIRKECLDRFGGFDETLRWGDYHLWLRMSRHYRIDFVPAVLTRYRQHSTQSTRSTPARETNEEPVALQALTRILAEYPEARQELGNVAIRRRLSKLYFQFAYMHFSRGFPQSARKPLLKAIRLWPLNPQYYVFYAASLLRPTHALAVREHWVRIWRNA